jgi:hypothetical protein
MMLALEVDESPKLRGAEGGPECGWGGRTLALRMLAVHPIVDAPCHDGDQAKGDQHFGDIERAHMHPPGSDYTPAEM